MCYKPNNLLFKSFAKSNAVISNILSNTYKYVKIVSNNLQENILSVFFASQLFEYGCFFIWLEIFFINIKLKIKANIVAKILYYKLK